MKKKSLLMIFTMLFIWIGKIQAQTIVNSLPDLVQYLDDDNANIKVAPGTYTITANDISNGIYGSLVPMVVPNNDQYAVFLFEGNNSTYDFTGVTINFKTEILTAFGNVDVREIQIIGNNNVLLNLTTVDDGAIGDNPTNRATNIVIDGASNRVEGFHVSVKGSYPYGYGDIFGKGGGSTIGHKKHSACLVRGNSNHLKNCTFISRSYGHGIFMQAANDAIIEGCHVEGELRTIAEVLAEEGTGSPADNVNFLTVWGYDLRNLTNDYRFSCQEDGIRAYNGGTTIVNGVEIQRTVTNATVFDNTIINMRSGVTLGLGKGTMYVENCTALGCESGFWGNNNASFVNCRGDASVGPLYSEDAERSGVTAELTLLDNHVTKIGNSPSLYIAGSNHNFTLHDGTTSFINEIEILMSGKRYAHRWLEGSGEEPPNRNASNITFNNNTEYPIILGNNATNNNVTSCGPVTNNGSGNTITVSNCNSNSLMVGDTFTTGSISYEVINDNPYKVTVTGSTLTALIIPSTAVDPIYSTPCTVTKIKGSAFYNNSTITSIVTPSTLTEIGAAIVGNDGTFRNTSSLVSADFYASTLLTELPVVLFRGSAIQSVILPSSLTTYGANSFRDCTSLTSVEVKNSIPAIIDTGVFTNLDLSKITLTVPEGTSDDYSVAAVWQDFGAILGLETIKNDFSFIMYPNPAKDIVIINNAFDTTLHIYNIQGVLELKLKISENEKVISLENLSSGVYFLKFKNDQGTVVKKLIKK